MPNLIDDVQINRAVASMRTRSERQTEIAKLKRAFVDVGILSQIDSPNNQILFGRRGTGKTHILKVYESNCRDRGQATVYLDARTLGSSSQFLDPALPFQQRCTALFRDLLALIHDGLLDHVILSPSEAPPGVLEQLNAMGDLVIEKRFEADHAEITIRDLEGGETSDSSGLEAATKSGFGFKYSEAGKSKSEREATTKMDVRKEDSIIFPAVHSAVASILSRLRAELVIAIDEWSSIPLDIQPFLAEFIRRSFFANPQVTVKIAALEQRSTFSLRRPQGVVGFELGADIGASLDLDDYYVYDRDPETVVQAFGEMLLRHLEADLPKDFMQHSYGIKSGKALVATLFEGKAFHDLVRTAEGVARDVIYIFSASFYTAKRKRAANIEKEHVLQEARQWFEQDKYQSLGQELRLALEAMTGYLIAKKRSRTFLVSAEDERHPVLQALLDARVIHLMRRGYVDGESSGVRFSVFNLDYGTYLHVANNPKYANDLELRRIDVTSSGKYINPFGDGRTLRRVVLPKELLPKSLEGHLN